MITVITIRPWWMYLVHLAMALAFGVIIGRWLGC